jgi:hypothetical protein
MTCESALLTELQLKLISPLSLCYSHCLISLIAVIRATADLSRDSNYVAAAVESNLINKARKTYVESAS